MKSSLRLQAPFARSLFFSTFACAVLFTASSDGAVVASIDWDNSDATADGVITGTLGGASVTLTTGSANSGGTPAFPTNGGVFIGTGTDWSVNIGSNDVPGISDPGVFNEAAIIDMGFDGSEGWTVISFSQPVINPTLLINFISAEAIHFDFDPTMPLLSLVDSVPPFGAFGIPAGIGDGSFDPVNRVFVNSGVGDNSKDSGFAVRLTGTFSEIGFNTVEGNSFLDEGTVAITVVATVPEPSSFALVLLSTLGLTMVRRRSR